VPFVDKPAQKVRVHPVVERRIPENEKHARNHDA